MERLRRIMTSAFAETPAIAEETQVPMRTAVYIPGFGRLAAATQLRGIYP